VPLVPVFPCHAKSSPKRTPEPLIQESSAVTGSPDHATFLTEGLKSKGDLLTKNSVGLKTRAEYASITCSPEIREEIEDYYHLSKN
jgi:hypothetical protein